LPEGHITGEADLARHGSDCLLFTLVGGVLLSAHMEAISESEYSDEKLSNSTLTGDRSACLECMVNLVGLSISLFFSGLFLGIFLRLFSVVFMAEGPPTSITLFTPWGSNLMTLGFTMLAAMVYLPKPSVPGK
jgi:hypothetical protein